MKITKFEVKKTLKRSTTTTNDDRAISQLVQE